MTHATDPTLIERAAEAIAREWHSGAIRTLSPHSRALCRAFARAALASVIPEAVEQEREACAKIADKRADSSNKDCERLSFDGSTGTLECSLSHRSDCLCQEHQEEAEVIAAAIRARTAEQKGDRHD